MSKLTKVPLPTPDGPANTIGVGPTEISVDILMIIGQKLKERIKI